MREWQISKKLNGKIEIHQLTISHNNHDIKIEIAVNVAQPEKETLISAILDEKLTLVFTYVTTFTDLHELRGLALRKTSESLQEMEHLCKALWKETYKIHHEQALRNTCKNINKDCTPVLNSNIHPENPSTNHNKQKRRKYRLQRIRKKS